jgi:uncharacterized protein YndB with AHSA1/START domain
VDPRLGGKFRIVMIEGRERHEHTGEYLAIEPLAASFTWISRAIDLRPTEVTIDFLERDRGTELALTHRRLPAAQLDSHRRGWTDIARELDLVVTQRGRGRPANPF